ncbi:MULTISPECIES: FxsA family protein [unclassified Salinivibrio]|uniref:FxsA family protein n=1 Tax=unclassified Salinivibrio TaxID=2636825 RepID=UPI0012CA194F|nr:membrane protein FxsA [Salinivibrio sp. VYel7]MPX91943.1 membrane protein FxsA [Salinivibrio sp. VYel1]MPX94848.1 membrane protein FxsA [Salinivibrio sp. VYel9]MPX97944.1 membrane protein FxsA [Salinivibrio sp. VYel6]MPY01223.1 membrane protein FxsA [Salinivibrio sp. VYel4]MPY04192.1 membrane protein FxsA [Salinivibrio sp. VYel5]MPY07170.1 membrane protein FxsA [Salinivibrio sp. VYel8]MPY15099.1 membrane protein FxsA [Salinivibrio sp. VGrn1]
MFPILLLLFILVPVIEIGLFIQVGGWLGLWPTLALVLITAFVGASLVRSQGLMTLASVQDRLNRGELPAQQILEGVMLAVAGVLLLTPGFMTDAMGMLVLLPGPRAALAKQVMKRVTVSQASFSQGNFHQGGNAQGPFGEDPFRRGGRGEDGNTFEGEYERKDDDDDDHRLR